MQFFATHSNINISQSIFEHNGFVYHYVFAEQQSTININTSTFISNSASLGILYLSSSNATIEQCIFVDNKKLHWD